MAAVLKITDDQLWEPFILMALHSNLEDHALAYALNGALGCRFQRTRKDLDLDTDIGFALFVWDDAQNGRYWTLIANKGRGETQQAQGGLFQDQDYHTTHYLVPERKEVNYLLKIEPEGADVDSEAILHKIKAVPNIMAAYAMEPEQLKSKTNLIF